MNDDENEIVCVRVLFSSFAPPFLCLQKKQKNSHQNTFALDFNMTGRGIHFCLTERQKKSEKRRERFSHEREKERKEERREPFVALRDKKNWYIELSSSSSS
jgi:hypothetical protein